MKILYDHQTFTLQKYGGISRYFYEIIARGIKEDIALVSGLISNNTYSSIDDNFKMIKLFPNLDFKGKLRLIRYLNTLHSIKQLKSSNFDIFHPTYYDPYFLSYIDKPYVITIHDLIHEKFPAFFCSKDQSVENKKVLINGASHIIAISNNTKKDLIEVYGVAEQKISVIYHGSSMKINKQVKEPLPNKEKYILYVGQRDVYKNFMFFIKAVSELLKKYSINLICAGGGKFSMEEREVIRRLGISDFIYQKDVNDENLKKLYNQAICFIFPSLYEGFGIPILEAFACGCPCVLSEIGAFREVAADSALFFNPYFENSLNEAVNKLIEDTALRTTLIENGFKKLDEFSWDQAYKRTLRIYENVIGN